MQMTSRHLQYELADNTVRGTVLSTLINAVVSEPIKEHLTAWSADAQHTCAQDSQAGPDIQWRLNNDLRVMSQYLRVLRDASKTNFFLRGEPVTCVEGLEWFHSLAQPISSTASNDLMDIHAFINECKHKGKYLSYGHAAFDAHRAIRRPDLRLTQYLLLQDFPDCSKTFEINVCAYMLADPSLTYQRWLNEFPKWREKGLYYPLALAAINMPVLPYWVPIQVQHIPVAVAFEDCLRILRNPVADHAQALQNLASAGQTTPRALPTSSQASLTGWRFSWA